MKKMTMLVMSVIAINAMAMRYEKVTMWRGETRAFIAHDPTMAEGEPPAGIKIRMGVAKEVKYRTRPFGTHFGMFADRVVWGSKDAGVKVLEVAVDREVKPGEYIVGDVKLKVLDRVMPPAKEWKYRLDLWQHPWAVSRYFGVKPFTREHYEKMRPLWELLATGGAKALTVTIMDRPWNGQCYDAYHSMIGRVKKADGTWEFDYQIFDEYVEFGRSCGLGPTIACYTMCPWDYEVSWENEKGERQAIKAIPGTVEFKEYWSDFLVDFAKHLKEKGWFEDAYIAMDEREPEDVQNIVKFVNEKAPGLKVSLACNRKPSEFKGIEIDDCCCVLDRLTPEFLAEAAERRDKGQYTTFYVCCNPTYPNTFASSEPEEAFWLGVYPAMAGLDGFLRWAWNSWPQDPEVDASFSGPGSGWNAADTYFVYPNGEPSYRFLELRNGIVAAEKLRILKERGEKKEAIAALKAKFDWKPAVENKADFWSLRHEVQSLVNE